MLTILGGCSFAAFQMVPIKPFESANATPYSTIHILNIESNTTEDIAAEISDLELELVERIRGLGTASRIILGDTSTSHSDALLIQISVSHVRKVSGGNRMVFGSMAGRASMTTAVEFVDGTTGTPLGSYEIVGQSGNGDFAGGTSDAIRKTAEAIVEIIEECYSDLSSPDRAGGAEGDELIVSYPEPNGDNARQELRLLSQSVDVELFADGLQQTTWKIGSLNASGHSIHEYTFRSSINILDKVLDREGNELSVEVNSKETHYEFRVQLQKPVQSDEEFTLIKYDKKIQSMSREGDHWVYEMNHTPGPAIQYSQTIKLPSGAELISAIPSPTRQSEDNESMILLYEKHLKRMEAFRCKVEYKAGISGRKTVQIPMRDGIKLATDLYFPASDNAPYPVIVMRSPYNKENLKAYGDYFSGEGYVLAVQDVRGRFESEGDWEPFIREGEDGYDTIEWLAEQDWSTGKIGMYGGSYSGSAQFAAAVLKPPHLVTIIPNITPAMPFGNMPYEGGLLLMGGNIRWIDIVENTQNADEIAQKVRDAFTRDWSNLLKYLPVFDLDERILGRKNPYWREWIEHNSNDIYWEKVNYLEKLKGLDIPVFLQSGWFDPGNRGTKLAYNSLKQSKNRYIKMIIGPWAHTDQSSKYLYGQYMGEAAGMDLFGLYTKWFDYWLKEEENGIIDEPLVQVFNMGPNYWLEADTYPLPETSFTKFYLSSKEGANTTRGDGKLLLQKSSAERQYDSYTYDPGDPSPCFFDYLKRRAIEDYKEVIATRDDILVYETDPLDEPLTIAGPVSAVLYASSSARDTDWCVMLYCVAENGEIYPIGQTGGVLRARFRNSFQTPEYLEKDEIYRYTIDLSHTGFTFSEGERIRMEISSAFYPEYSRNLNTGGHNEMETEYVSAIQRIYFYQEYPSHLILPAINPDK